MIEVRDIHLVGATGAVRTEMRNGQERLVIPVIALLGDVVIHAVNAPAPELVPLETLSAAPFSWNGRPVTLGHPQRNGRQVSANTPEVLEAHAFGEIFNAAIVDKKLTVEAWVDLERALALGGQAFVDGLRAGKQYEVSVGAFVGVEKSIGEMDGRKYSAKWLSISPDHLAFLPTGIGACSIEMGCGAHRTAEAYLITAEGELKTIAKEEAKGAPMKRLLARIRAALMPEERDASLGDRDMRDQLAELLRQVEPAFGYIEMVYPKDQEVVYSLMPPSYDMNGPYVEGPCYRRSYEMTKDKITSVNADRTEVEEVRTWEPVAAAGARNSASDMKRIQAMHDTSVELGAACSPTTAEHKPCGCGQQPAAAASTEETEEMTDKTTRIAALVAKINEVPEDRLAVLEAAAGVTPTPPAPTPAPAPSPAPTPSSSPAPGPTPSAPTPAPTRTAEARPMTEEEWLASAPESVKTLVARQRQAEADTKAALVNGLKTAQTVFGEDELKGMSNEQLAKLAQLAHVEEPVSYVGARPMPRAAAENDVYLNPPDPYAAALEARRKAEMLQ